jgi:hypothetical protein
MSSFNFAPIFKVIQTDTSCLHAMLSDAEISAAKYKNKKIGQFKETNELK